MSGPRYVSVIGASRATPELAAQAEELGELLAERGCVIVCGGRDGVMAAVARGVKRKGGVTIGILPEADRERAAPDLTYSVCSAMGYARNLSVVSSRITGLPTLRARAISLSVPQAPPRAITTSPLATTLRLRA